MSNSLNPNQDRLVSVQTVFKSYQQTTLKRITGDISWDWPIRMTHLLTFYVLLGKTKKRLKVLFGFPGRKYFKNIDTSSCTVIELWPFYKQFWEKLIDIRMVILKVCKTLNSNKKNQTTEKACTKMSQSILRENVQQSTLGSHSLEEIGFLISLLIKIYVEYNYFNLSTFHIMESPI